MLPVVLAGCSVSASAATAPQYPPGAYQGQPPPAVATTAGPQYPPGAYQGQPVPTAPGAPVVAAPPAVSPAPAPPVAPAPPPVASAPPPGVAPASPPVASAPPPGAAPAPPAVASAAPSDPCAYHGYCPYEGPCEPKVPPPECRETQTYDHVAAFAEGLVVRVGGYRLEGGPDPHATHGFLVSIDPDVFHRRGGLNSRGMLYAALGGGSAGLEGQLEGSVTSGSHLGTATQAVFLRGGFGGQVLGNNDLYRSHFELPRLETGYQVFGDTVALELQASSGLVLGGRYNVGTGAKRRIDTVPEVGASATLQSDVLRLHLSGLRIFAVSTGNGSPIDELRADLCGELADIVVICAHGAAHQGDVHWRDGHTERSAALYGGVTFGIGAIDVE